MRYRGIDIHSQTSVWCLLDQAGEVVAEGKMRTNTADLQKRAKDLNGNGALRAAQEVGTRACLVHDALTAAGMEILFFNAAQLRMIAASRKKTAPRYYQHSFSKRLIRYLTFADVSPLCATSV